mgnify:CR=1 FL=1
MAWSQSTDPASREQLELRVIMIYTEAANTKLWKCGNVAVLVEHEQ